MCENKRKKFLKTFYIEIYMKLLKSEERSLAWYACIMYKCTKTTVTKYFENLNKNMNESVLKISQISNYIEFQEKK